MDRFPAVLHHLLQQLDEQFRIERAVVGAEPERALGIDRRSGAERLPLPGPLHHRRLAANAPGLAMHRIGAEAGLIPEEDVSALRLGLPGDGRVGFPLPALDGFRIALIGALQRLLRRQPELRQQFADRGQPKPDAKLLLDQLGHHRARPQTKVQAVLARVTAIDPAEHLPLLRRRQTARPSRRFGRAQRLDPHPRLQRRLEPLVDRRAIESVGRNHLRRRTRLRAPAPPPSAELLQRLMIKCTDRLVS